MLKALVYTSPARGHLYPLVPTLQELARRGHQVTLRTLGSEVERMRGLGFSAKPIAAAVEARKMDDWKAGSPPAALAAACRAFVERADSELEDVGRALREERPDLLFVDVNSWGAAAVAEASGLPWAVFAPYLLPIAGPGVPPWGLGLPPREGWVGRLRDAALWAVVNALYDRALPALNRMRAKAGVSPVRHVAELATRAPCVVCYTAEPFEYARAVWPRGVRLVGPGIWEPAAGLADGPVEDGRPLILVTCSTEFQDDGALVEAALAAFADQPVRLVVTTAANDPKGFLAPANARVERFISHGPLLRSAACVVCHGGMGITQKALAAGVPVCIVPFGRDQLEVARHVEVAEAGVRLPRQRLSAQRLRKAVEQTLMRQAGARRVAEGFARAGGAPAAASALEALVPEPRRSDEFGLAARCEVGRSR